MGYVPPPNLWRMTNAEVAAWWAREQRVMRAQRAFAIGGGLGFAVLVAIFVVLASRSHAQLPYSAEARYGPNPQQTIRLFPAASPGSKGWILWFLNSNYAQDFQLATLSPQNEPLASLHASGLDVVTATVTYPGQAVTGGGRFLPPEHANYPLGDRVERDAVLAWLCALEHAGDWGLHPLRGLTGGRSGGSHPALWLAWRQWPEVTFRPRGCIAIGAHTWWPAWNQALNALPAHHFYHVNDTALVGLLNANNLSQTARADQIASSFLSYAVPTHTPTVWYAADSSIEVTALSPLPAGTISAGHSPWFSMAGYAHAQAISPHAKHRLLLDPAVAPVARANGLAVDATSDAQMPAALVVWAREVLGAAP